MATNKSKKNQVPAVEVTDSATRRDNPDFEKFGREILAPIVTEYLARLHSTVLAAAHQGVPALFCHRAGLRILHLYSRWLAARNQPVPKHVRTFKTSRIAALKASYKTAPDLAITGIGMQLNGLDLHEVASVLLEGNLNYDGPRLEPMPLHEFMRTDHIVADQIRQHLTDQSGLMADYLQKLAQGSSRLLLVDSGWAGTTQLVLEQAFPNYNFEGIYFGTIGRANILGIAPGQMHGLMFNTADFTYDPKTPETIFALHRHLIESLFEPDIPSVTSITRRDISGAEIKPAALERPSCKWDHMFGVVLNAVVAHAGQGPAQRTVSFAEALNLLSKTIIFPTKELANIAAGKFRSIDLGREGGVEPLLPARVRFDGDTAELRINDALWHAGQAALEYAADDSARIKAQKQLLSRFTHSNAKIDYFVSSTSWERKRSSKRNDVAIITRTKDRPTLLRRAAESVEKQSLTDYEWVIVNDGGSLADVMDVITSSMVDPSRITICHNEKSLGMEGASNAGISGSSSEWLVIHDDDDSWHPEFLKEAVEFLDSNSSTYAGVITGTVLVSEEIVNDTVVEHGRHPYQEWVKTVHLAEMATGNFFAPIAFVYSRAIYDQIGGYDAKLPVLGDWDFNLRFLLEADIGVITKPLAFYHHRNGGANSTYSNSVVGGLDKHLAYNSIVRNKYVRESATNPKMGILANLVNAGYLHSDTRARIDGTRNEISQTTHSIKQIETNTAALPSDTHALDSRWILACALASELIGKGSSASSVSELLSMAQAKGIAAVRAGDIAPPPDFDETAYLATYPDIAASVQRGDFPCGYAHYVLYGRHEGRVRPAA